MIDLNYKKIAIIGCAGSGKTTLALQLQTLLNLPVIHLDRYYWKLGWQRPNFEEFSALHEQLCQQEQWIMDGIYTRTLPVRLAYAQMIIFLDVSRARCLWNVLKRWLCYYGHVRDESVPPGCYERFSVEFLQWIWSFNKKNRPSIIDLLGQYKDQKKIYIFRSKREMEQFLAALKRDVHY